MHHTPSQFAYMPEHDAQLVTTLICPSYNHASHTLPMSLRKHALLCILGHLSFVTCEHRDRGNTTRVDVCERVCECVCACVGTCDMCVWNQNRSNGSIIELCMSCEWDEGDVMNTYKNGEIKWVAKQHTYKNTKYISKCVSSRSSGHTMVRHCVEVSTH